MDSSIKSTEDLMIPKRMSNKSAYKININSPLKHKTDLLSSEYEDYNSYAHHGPPPPSQDIPADLLNYAEIDTIKQIMEIQCTICGMRKGYCRKIAGCASFSWCTCLLICTCVGFWIPFVCTRCYDIEIVCSQCGYIKASLQANCL